jgi:hypothetical protein
MDGNAPSTQTFATMFDGFTQALARFQGAAKNADGNAAYVPLFETLNWAVVLDDRTRQYWAPEGEVLGWQWRERVPGAEVMAGVRFARNRAHHQWSDALRLDDGGFQFPMSFPLNFWEWVWRPANELPRAGRTRTAKPRTPAISRVERLAPRSRTSARHSRSCTRCWSQARWPLA